MTKPEYRSPSRLLVLDLNSAPELERLLSVFEDLRLQNEHLDESAFEQPFASWNWTWEFETSCIFWP